MAKGEEIVGTGITARSRATYSGEDMGPALLAIANRWNKALAEGGGRFAAVVLDVERTCLAVLVGAGRIEDYERVRHSVLTGKGGEAFEPDNTEDYAWRVLRLITLTKGMIAKGDADGAARMALNLGGLITEHHVKTAWEADALRGEKNAAALKQGAQAANEGRQLDGKQRHATWQAMADKMWASNPYLSKNDIGKSIAAELGGDFHTIRRKITRK